jgi:hypothetical protein
VKSAAVIAAIILAIASQIGLLFIAADDIDVRKQRDELVHNDKHGSHEHYTQPFLWTCRKCLYARGGAPINDDPTGGMRAICFGRPDVACPNCGAKEWAIAEWEAHDAGPERPLGFCAVQPEPKK